MTVSWIVSCVFIQSNFSTFFFFSVKTFTYNKIINVIGFIFAFVFPKN